MAVDSVPAYSLNQRRRVFALVLFGALVGAFLLIKVFHTGWFLPQEPLPVGGKPILALFTLSRGCDCQMTIVQNAEAQIASWQVPERLGVTVIRVDFGRRPDLARQYQINRAPALVLFDAQGHVRWKQDEGLSDAAPLDLEQAGQQLEALLGSP